MCKCYDNCTNGCVDASCAAQVTGTIPSATKSSNDKVDDHPSTWYHSNSTINKGPETNKGTWTEGSIMNGSSTNSSDNT